jgi:hypothetical protein
MANRAGRAATVGALTLWCLVGGAGSAQSKPDFSGYWVVESPRASDPDIPRVLGVRHAKYPRTGGRQSERADLEIVDVERRVPEGVGWTTHQFDLTDGKLASGDTQVYPSARWDGVTLLLDNRFTDRHGRTLDDWVERREQWRLESGRLRINTSVTGSARAPRTVTARYRKFVPPPLADPEAYAVYASLLTERSLEESGKTLIIQRETTPYYHRLPDRSSLEGDWVQVLDNYLATNAIPRAILTGRNLPRPYAVLSHGDIMRGFDHSYGSPQSDGWSALRARYPDSRGIRGFSAVGFNPSRTRALVYSFYQCGGLCGAGSHHLLEKVEGRWQPATLPKVFMCNWIS